MRPQGVGLALDGDRVAIAGWLSVNTPPGRWPVDVVIPLHHKRLGTAPATWSAYVIALNVGAPSDGSAADRRDAAGALAAGLIEAVEYVTSRPEAGDEYYRTQYEFSGPAMRRLHARDRNGRFVGVEIVDSPFRTDAMPEHDVIHVSGFTVWQTIKAIPHFRGAFEAAAADIGRPSGQAIM